MFNPQPNVYLKKSEEMRLGLQHSHSTAFDIASVASHVFPVLRRDYFGQHRYTPYVYIFERALRWRENPTIHKEQMQTKYSDVINFYSIIAGYCCSLDPLLYCPGLYRPCFAFLLWMTRSKWSTSPGTFVFDL